MHLMGRYLTVIVLALVVGCGAPSSPIPRSTTDLAKAISEYEYQIVYAPLGEAGNGTSWAGPTLSGKIVVTHGWDADDRVTDRSMSFVSLPKSSVSIAFTEGLSFKEVAVSLSSNPEGAAELLNHSLPQVRYFVLAALRQYVIADKASPSPMTEELGTLADSSDFYAACHALHTLKFLAVNHPYHSGTYQSKAFTKGIEHPSTEVRLEALGYLSRCRLTAKQAEVLIPRLADRLLDRDRLVQSYAMSTLSGFSKIKEAGGLFLAESFSRDQVEWFERFPKAPYDKLNEGNERKVLKEYREEVLSWLDRSTE